MLKEILSHLEDGNYKGFKESVEEVLISRISLRLQELKEEIASDVIKESKIFNEEKNWKRSKKVKNKKGK